MKKISAILSGIPSFSGLSERQIEELRKIVVNRHFNKGQIIFSEGDNGNGFYVLVSGLVKIFKVSLEGKEHIMRVVGAGEPFGQVAVYAGRSFPANAQSIAKSHLLFFPRTAFVEMITKNPSLAMNMLSVLSMRLREFTVHVENLALKEVPGRLAAYLIYLADEEGGNDSFTLGISKGQLASLLSTSPETLSRILAQMVGKNLIEVIRRDITILDLGGLKELAEHGRSIT
ncbi:MAG: Crp/Fnr family transcriptional regulator [Deltaproteobacteria bacterium]|nr:Crp/Fnr family transcriptional regulator [Deltaproteobacteria bacterium]